MAAAAEVGAPQEAVASVLAALQKPQHHVAHAGEISWLEKIAAVLLRNGIRCEGDFQYLDFGDLSLPEPGEVGALLPAQIACIRSAINKARRRTMGSALPHWRCVWSPQVTRESEAAQASAADAPAATSRAPGDGLLALLEGNGGHSDLACHSSPVW